MIKAALYFMDPVPSKWNALAITRHKDINASACPSYKQIPQYL
jgi:hypothetical protein